MELDHLLLTTLAADEQRGLRLQAEGVVGTLGAKQSAEAIEDLARRVVHDPRLTPYSAEWRYLLALELRRVASTLPATRH